MAARRKGNFYYLQEGFDVRQIKLAELKRIMRTFNMNTRKNFDDLARDFTEHIYCNRVEHIAALSKRGRPTREIAPTQLYIDLCADEDSCGNEHESPGSTKRKHRLNDNDTALEHPTRRRRIDSSQGNGPDDAGNFPALDTQEGSTANVERLSQEGTPPTHNTTNHLLPSLEQIRNRVSAQAGSESTEDRFGTSRPAIIRERIEDSPQQPGMIIGPRCETKNSSRRMFIAVSISTALILCIALYYLWPHLFAVTKQVIEPPREPREPLEKQETDYNVHSAMEQRLLEWRAMVESSEIVEKKKFNFPIVPLSLCNGVVATVIVSLSRWAKAP